MIRVAAVLVAALMVAACNNDREPTYQGWIEANLIFVSPDESGRIETLSVREGQHVVVQAPLFTLDDDLQDAEVAEREASLRNAQAAYDRAVALLRTNAGTQKSYEEAEAAMRTAKARLNSSQTRLARRKVVQSGRGHGTASLFPCRRDRYRQTAGGRVAAARQLEGPLFRQRSDAAETGARRHHNVQCDGCPSGLTAKVSFIARTAEYTPPVIYSLEERSKLVFMIEALPAQPEQLRVGQPITVSLVAQGGSAVTAAPDIAIDVRGLSKSFGNRKVVRDLSMQVRRGTIYGFLGPNGSGKTTTIRMLTGLLTPDEGEGTCLGYDIRTEADEIKRHVGYMTQRFSLYQDLSVRENLEFVARLYGIPRPAAAARAMIEHLGLNGREEQLAGELSGGWKQRLALGACTLPNPQLLLLDEPTAGVDPKARREFWNEIHALAAQGLTVLVSTHYMDEAERCHEIAYIAYGVLLARGTVSEVIAAAHLTTYTVEAPDPHALAKLAEELENLPGVDMVAPFGNSLHISGRDKAALEAAIAPYRDRPDVVWTLSEPTLEDVFIDLMSRARDNFQ